MSEKRFEITEYGSDYYIEIIDNEKELDESIHNPSQKLSLIECVDLLNEQQSRIKELEKENDDLRTTITKQVEAITEMKGIIYMLQGLRIEDYSSEIEENMVKLQKAYDGNLEDFLNYFKDGCFDE